MSMQERKIFPIRFDRLFVGSKFRIFAEPSRRLRRSTDETVYYKECEAYSIADGTRGSDEERVAILMPNDLVLPLSRGRG